ncbi:hypothetical protein E8E12_005770 [Didymella heteroderae]|uniref:Uncharacterized protein n=1 Tax=Didymella heteroderae TaxID=1769908 RepID=A0A9P4WPI6_9PLEO|nr:hypothetical protein E8E12_005770 [Didymella heteroderae]
MSSYGLPLGRLYGPAWLNKELWFPDYKCVWTAEKDQSGHHCPDQECDAEIETSCYEKLHIAFCFELDTIPNGHKRFCGHRFQAESPRACALHGWGSNDENRVFQRAMKRLSFQLPDLIPHEQPGWEMALTPFGCLHQIHIRTGYVDGKFCFVRVLSWLADGQPDEVQEIPRVRTKEMQMTETYPCVALRKAGAIVEMSPEKKAAEASVKIKQNVKEFNNQFSYQKFNNHTAQVSAEEKLAANMAKEAKDAAREAKRAATATKGGKKCVRVGAAKHLRMRKPKKKNYVAKEPS